MMRLGPGHDIETAADLFASLVQRPPWMAEAACRGRGDEIDFFPGQGGDPRPAKALCATCPVSVDCAAYAAEMVGPVAGIWAGATASGRRKADRPAA